MATPPPNMQDVLPGIRSFNELVADARRSTLLMETQPKAVDAVTALHQRMLTHCGLDLPNYQVPGWLAKIDSSVIAATYAKDQESRGALLRLLHDVIKYSAPLAHSHPEKGPNEAIVAELRHEIMTFLVDSNPFWLTAYRNSPEGNTRQERHALAIALGGHSIGATPLERLLASAGEIIDTMADMPDQSSWQKARLLGKSYEIFAEAYAFDPAKIQLHTEVRETDLGPVTVTTFSCWNGIEQRDETMTISTSPGEEPMRRSQLIEAAAQSRWGRGEISENAAADIARFSRHVLDYALPERQQSRPAGELMARLSQTLESSLSRYAPAEYEVWKQRDIVATRLVQMTRTQLSDYFATQGFTTGIGHTPLAAATALTADQPAYARFLPSEGLLVISEFGSAAGLWAALEEDFPNATLHAGQYAPGPAGNALVTSLSKTLDYLDDDQCRRLADLLSGEIDPEDIEQTRAWISQCYHRPSENELLMHACNALMDGHGVEYLSGDAYGDGTSGAIEFVNVGGPDIPTLLRHEGQFYLADIDTMIEALEQRQCDEREGRDWAEMPIKNPYPMPTPLVPLIERKVVDREIHQPMAEPTHIALYR